MITHIISGVLPFRFNGVCYSIHQPRRSLLLSAEEFSSNLAEENKYGFWLSDGDIEDILIRQGVWDKCNDVVVKNLTTTLDNYKVDLYKNYLTNPTAVKKTRHFISVIRNKINKVFEYRYSLYQWTLKYYLDTMKNRYLAMYTIYKDGKRVYDDNVTFNEISFHLIDTAIKYKLKNTLTDTLIRKAVREEPWKTLWSIGKPNPFEFNILELTDNQKLMIIFSRMYDSVMQSNDCPPNNIIEDDDALDGWMINNRREIEKYKIDNKVQSNLTEKQKWGREIFIPVNNVEEAKQIEQLNDAETQRIKKERQAVINKKGVAKDIDFLDNRLNVNMMQIQKFMQRK